MTTDAQLKRNSFPEPEWEPSTGDVSTGREAAAVGETNSGERGKVRPPFDLQRERKVLGDGTAATVQNPAAIVGALDRTDRDIEHAADLALQWVSHLPKGAIGIQVENGVITLSGEVEWESQRRNATSAVRYLVGVTDIIDNIKLNSCASAQGIGADIVAALRRHSGTFGQHIEVDVKDGDVTLSGTVPNWWARELARESAWSVPGVRRVTDKLHVDVWPRVGRRP